MKWFDAGGKIAEGMDRISEFIMNYMWSKFLVWGQRSHHLPFCRLQLVRRHKFGRLRLWPKYKALGPSLAEWTEVSYRPLISHFGHH